MPNRLHLYLITWNCARIPGVTTSFTEYILDGIPEGSAAPDILVLSLQETAPISYAFLGGRYLDPYVHPYVTAIQNATSTALGEDFSLVGSNSVGMTVVLVFVKDRNLDKVKYVGYGGVGCGLWEMGNKAGVGVKLAYEVHDSVGEGNENWPESRIVEINFVGAHLSPHEWLVDRRNQDWESIVRGLVFEKQLSPQSDDDSPQRPLLDGDTELENTPVSARSIGLYSPAAHTFVMGDLNYRTALDRPTLADRLLFPQPNHHSNGTIHISKLLERDQCHLERLSHRTLHGLMEAEINFPPSYKYRVRMGAEYDPNRWEWAEGRWPSWTDRIVYLPMNTGIDNSQDDIMVHRYTSIPQIMDSDHKPVTCYLSIPAKSLSTSRSVVGASLELRKNDIRHYPPFPINNDWKRRREAARTREVTVGVAAFFTTTRVGAGILIGALSGLFSIWWLLAG